MTLASITVEPRPLPVPILPYADETAASLASRAALEYARGDATAFLTDLGLRFEDVSFGVPDAVTKLAIWLGADPKALLDATPGLRPRNRPTLRGRSFFAYPSHRLRPRICPVCLAEDRQIGPAQEHMRTLWSMPSVWACPKHGVYLEDLPRPKGYRGLRDLHFCLNLWPTGFLPAARPVARHMLATAVSDFLQGGSDRVGPWSWEEVLATAPLLGCFVDASPVGPVDLDRDRVQSCTETGFALLQAGKEAVMDATSERVAQELAGGAQSPSQVLGPLLGPLRVIHDEPLLRPFIDALHAAAEQRMRRHASHSFLCRTIPPFDHATIETLSQRHGAAEPAVRLALKADAVRPIAEVSVFGRTYQVYDQDAADKTLQKLKGNLTFSQAGKLLGMNRPTFRQVWNAKLIARNPDWPERRALLWKHQVEALLEALHADAPVVTQPLGADWVSLSDFSRRSRLGQAETGRLLIAGALAPAVRLSNRAGWASIRVRAAHIRTHRKPPPTPAQRRKELNLTTIARRYELRLVTVARLVEIGAFPPPTRPNTNGRRIGWYSVATVKQFFEHHRTLRDLARSHTCSWQMMASALARLGARPLLEERNHTRIFAVKDLPSPERMAAEVKASKARNARFKRSV